MELPAGSLPSPTVTYVDSGTYSVSLIITTASGCSDTAVYQNAIRTGTIPPVDFSFTYAGTCANSGVAFKPIVTPELQVSSGILEITPHQLIKM